MPLFCGFRVCWPVGPVAAPTPPCPTRPAAGTPVRGRPAPCNVQQRVCGMHVGPESLACLRGPPTPTPTPTSSRPTPLGPTMPEQTKSGYTAFPARLAALRSAAPRPAGLSGTCTRAGWGGGHRTGARLAPRQTIVFKLISRGINEEEFSTPS